MASANPYLEFETDGRPRLVEVEAMGVCRIGRAEHNNVVLTDDVASREHAMVRRDALGRCYLSDSGSRNGTTLNGRPVIRPMALSNGDVIRIGKQQLTFHTPDLGVDAAAPTAAATQFLAAQSLITVLVADMRGFTPLSREIGEERISALMANLFRDSGHLLDSAGAWSQKFIGDAIMGVWKHEGATLDAEMMAMILGVVIEMENMFALLQERFGLERPVRFGAAINTGYASIGNMGSASAQDFTALGEVVNKAFRLETATKDLGCDLAIGRSSIDFLMPPMPATQLPPAADATIKGYDTSERVHVLKFGEIGWFARLVQAERPAATLLSTVPLPTRPLPEF